MSVELCVFAAPNPKFTQVSFSQEASGTSVLFTRRISRLISMNLNLFGLVCPTPVLKPMSEPRTYLHSTLEHYILFIVSAVKVVTSYSVKMHQPGY